MFSLPRSHEGLPIEEVIRSRRGGPNATQILSLC